jgi:HlyD family secretion protein
VAEDPHGHCECIPIRAPVSGRLLRLVRESEGVVQAGEPLAEIGDPTDLEIVVDVLSADAVKIEPGQSVVIDLTSPPETWRRLGHGYRVEARILLWEADAVLALPQSSPFRNGDGWGVFVIENGEARTRPVELGHRTGLRAEITSGLEPGETVVRFPNDRVADGVRVAAR